MGENVQKKRIRMPGNSFGHMLQLTSWGESHGPAIGGVLDGVPPGIELNLECIQDCLNKRRPGQNDLTTKRQESDQVEILSGLFEGKTLGTPIAFMVRNHDKKSSDYDALKNVYRPGHGDYSYQQKYKIRDHRGGGRSSARTTISIVVAGAIAEQILKNLYTGYMVRAAIVQLGTCGINRDVWSWESTIQNPFHCPDSAAISTWTSYLEELRDAGKSCGAMIEVYAGGVPAGLGEPVFDKLDGDLAKILMGINAVKGVEIGLGMDVVEAEHAFDEMAAGENVLAPQFLSNNAGGILAGISTGQPIVARVAFKPTSSTKAPRQTIDTDGMPVSIAVEGRHDPCVALRAVPIVEAAVSLVLADHALRWRGQCG